jgi:molybdopterin-guanine dinucleotide biosynthesis protein A
MAHHSDEQKQTVTRSASAIVLAGGRSRRMGRDKAALPIGDRTMLQHILAQLEPHVGELLISVDQPGRYPEIGAVAEVVDRFPGAGPLAALASALAQVRHERALVVACDVPELPLSLIETLLIGVQEPGGDAVIPTIEERPQYLLAAYRSAIAPTLIEAVQRGKRAAGCLLDLVRVRLVALTGPSCNLNTPQQYQHYLKTRSQDRGEPSKAPGAKPGR